MVVARRSRTRLTDLPPEVISCVLAAAFPDEAAVAAGLSATCRRLRGVVLSCCITEASMRHFGRGQQIASLLRRLTGLQKLTLASCGLDATLWLEVKQLHNLRHLTLPLALKACCMQPLTTLQQLTGLAFTSEYNTTDVQIVLPTTSIAALSSLQALDASACADFSAAGVQELSTLQHLEVLRVPTHKAEAITRLAACLPRLRSLDLQCCSTEHLGAGFQLTLAAATALTELRLHVYGGGAETVRRLQMPPHLQALDVSILVSSEYRADDVLAVINALPLQHLVSLDLLRNSEHQRDAYGPPRAALQLPEALPRLTQLRFGGYCDWDALHHALWPLAILAAQEACHSVGNSGPTAGAAGADVPPKQTGSSLGGTWRLQVQVCELVYSLTAADILHPVLPDGTNTIQSTMRGRLTSATFLNKDAFRMVQEGEPGPDMLQGLLTHETQLTRLDLPAFTLPREDIPTMFQQLGNLAALQHLDAMAWWPQLTSDDCCSLEQLCHLTRLALPCAGEASPAAVQACLPALTNLRQLKGQLPVNAGTLAALKPLRALTLLHLNEGGTDNAADSNTSRRKQRQPCHGAVLQTLRLPLRQFTLENDDVKDKALAKFLGHTPFLQELNVRFNFALSGSGLEALPNCCPCLKILRLRHLPSLTACFLPALQHLADLAVFEVVASPLAEEVPPNVAAYIPPNLTTLQLHYMPSTPPYVAIPDGCQCEAGPYLGFGAFVTEFLESMPLLRAPLRVLKLQRGNKTPFTDMDIEDLTMMAAQQLEQLETLDLGAVMVTDIGLQWLDALPALVELHVHTFTDDLDMDGDDHDEKRGCSRHMNLMDDLGELAASFKRQGRRLITFGDSDVHDNVDDSDDDDDDDDND